MVRCTPLLIADSWGDDKQGGVMAVRRFELRIADAPSFNDGVHSFGSFQDGFLGEFISAEKYDDLVPLLISGVGTDNLVKHNADTKEAYFKMVDDFTFVVHVVRELIASSASIELINSISGK